MKEIVLFIFFIAITGCSSSTEKSECTDLNCDGWPDIIFSQTQDQGSYFIDSWAYLGSPDGYSISRRLNFPTTGAMGVAVGDLNKDGYPDVVFASVQDGTSREVNSLVYYGSAEGYSIARRVELATVGCSSATIADVNTDGWSDIVFTNRYKGDQAQIKNSEGYHIDSYVYWGSPEGFMLENRLELPTVGAAMCQVYDLDSDGYNDIVFANGVMESIWKSSFIYWGSSSGWSELDRTELETVFPEGVVVDDLNNDEYPDILFTSWLSFSGDANYIYWGNVNADYSNDNRYIIEGATGTTIPKVADLNKDGFKDLIMPNGGVNPVTHEFAKTSYIYYGSAEGFPKSRRIGLSAFAAAAADAADLNVDGFADVVIASHYARNDSSPEVSQIYWGSASGYSEENLTEIPSLHASGVVIVGGRQ